MLDFHRSSFEKNCQPNLVLTYMELSTTDNSGWACIIRGQPVGDIKLLTMRLRLLHSQSNSISSATTNATSTERPLFQDNLGKLVPDR